jgi:uncharacterized membrane protein
MKQTQGKLDSSAIPQQQAGSSSTVMQYQGPIPTSAEMDRYERTLPGAAHRILTMAENEQAKRHLNGDADREANVGIANRGLNVQIGSMIAAFIITLVCIGAAIYFATINPWLSGVVFTTTIGVLATAFVYDRRHKAEINK